MSKTARQTRAVFVWSKIELGRTARDLNQRATLGHVRFGAHPMAKSATIGLDYGALRKQCLEAVRQWPGCETVGGIQIIRDKAPGGFSVRVTLYGTAEKKIADRAINCVQREKRRHFHLKE
jgi:hypothetical protein